MLSLITSDRAAQNEAVGATGSRESGKLEDRGRACAARDPEHASAPVIRCDCIEQRRSSRGGAGEGPAQGGRAGTDACWISARGREGTGASRSHRQEETRGGARGRKVVMRRARELHRRPQTVYAQPGFIGENRRSKPRRRRGWVVHSQESKYGETLCVYVLTDGSVLSGGVQWSRGFSGLRGKHVAHEEEWLTHAEAVRVMAEYLARHGG
jgi:hypothetical protein